MNPQVETAFKIAERSVKQLLHSYFKLFENAKTASGIVKAAAFRIPTKYISTCSHLTKMSMMPSSFIKKGTIYYVPEDSTPFTFEWIPKSLIDEQQNIIKEFKESVNIFESTLSQLNQPNQNQSNQNQCKRDKEMWNVTLNIIDKPLKDISTANLSNFDGNTGQVIKAIKNALSTAVLVFVFYIKEEPDFKTLSLNLDETKLVLSLKDSRYEEYEHPIKISYTLSKSS